MRNTMHRIAALAFAIAFAQGLNAAESNGHLDLAPTFASCGVEFASPRPIDGLRLEWQAQGDVWNSIDALEFPYFPSDGAYRGSIRDLSEDTE